ncbi:MAG: hypothetical protein IT438_16455, partial [Phycisphaerales bacterium]|nr:hypothetical protein [Phycisphaerales bacterium]
MAGAATTVAGAATTVPGEDDQGAWARWFNQQGQRDRGFKISQRKRRLDEEIFGWLK